MVWSPFRGNRVGRAQMMENCFVPPSNEVVRNDNDIAATKANHGERLVGHPLTVAKKKNLPQYFRHNYCDRSWCFVVIGHGCKTALLPQCPHSIPQPLVTMSNLSLCKSDGQKTRLYISAHKVVSHKKITFKNRKNYLEWSEISMLNLPKQLYVSFVKKEANSLVNNSQALPTVL